jgi:hypothetical protein
LNFLLYLAFSIHNAVLDFLSIVIVLSKYALKEFNQNLRNKIKIFSLVLILIENRGDGTVHYGT